MIRSLRARMLIWVFCAFGVLLAGFGGLIFRALQSSLSRDFDEVLTTTAHTICGFVEQTKEGFRVEIDDRQVPEFQRAVRPEYFQIWREDGSTLAHSRSIGDKGLTRIEAPLDQFVFRSLLLPDGRPGRAVGIKFDPKTDEDVAAIPTPGCVTLVVARDTSALEAELAYLRWLLFAGTAGTIALGLGVGVVVVRQGLRPLNGLAAQISDIRHDALSATISADRVPAEMVPVVERLNDLLKRLDAAFQREREFSADVAHELRTPLAGMRCTLEVALQRPRTTDEYRSAMRETLEIIGRTQNLIDHLLLLARLEEGKAVLQPRQVRLGEFVGAAWQPLAESAKTRGIALDMKIPENLFCTADPDTLKLILSNLLENAAEYTDEHGKITLTAALAGGYVEFAVSNTGCRLNAEDVSHIFERFWRGDKARTRTGVHSGLGLVLVKRAAAALGGSVDAGIARGLFTARLRLNS